MSSATSQAVAFSFLSDDRLDAELVKKQALPELATLLGASYGIELGDCRDPVAMRSRFASYVLRTDFVAGIGGALPGSMKTVRIASAAMQSACVDLARVWRMRRDCRERYVDHATRIAKELDLERMEFVLEQISESETFLETERALQRLVERSLLEGPTDRPAEISRQRQSSFWSEQLPDVQAEWALVATIANVLLHAGQVESALRCSGPDIGALVRAYTQRETALCLLDREYRHMERRYHTFDCGCVSRRCELEQLISAARDRYMQAASVVAECFLRRYRDARFRVSGILRKTEIYERVVKPCLDEGKTACVWVDALRYEMGRELAQTLVLRPAGPWGLFSRQPEAHRRTMRT